MKQGFLRRLLSLPLMLALALALPAAARAQPSKPGDTLAVAFNRADNVIRGTGPNDCGIARALDAAYRDQFPTRTISGKTWDTDSALARVRLTGDAVVIGQSMTGGDPKNYNWDCLRDRLLGNPAFPNLTLDLSGMPELRAIGGAHLPPGDNPVVSAEHIVILPEGLKTVGDYALWCGLLSAVQSAASGSEAPNRGLPSGLKTIGANAIGPSLALDKLPDGVESIGEFAFYNNPNVVLNALPAGLTTIGQFAFQGCPNVAPAELPSGLTSVGQTAFSGTGIGRRANNRPGRLILPEGLTRIEPLTFFECGGLGEVVLPPSVVSIGVGAFGNCEKLKAVFFEGKAPGLQDDYYIDSLPELYPSGVAVEMAFGRQSYDSVTQISTYSLSTGPSFFAPESVKTTYAGPKWAAARDRFVFYPDHGKPTANSSDAAELLAASAARGARQLIRERDRA